MISKVKWESNVKMSYKQSSLPQILLIFSITGKYMVYRWVSLCLLAVWFCGNEHF